MEKSLFTSSQGRYDINRYLDYVFQGNNDALRNRLDFLFSEGNLDDAQYDHLSGLIGLFNQAKSELAPVLVDSESGSELLELPALMNEVYPKILYTLIEDSSQDVQPIDELWKITTSIIDRNAQYLPLSLVKWKYLVAKLLDEHQKNNVVDSYEEMPQKLKDDIGPTVPNEITIFQKKSDEASIVEEGLALPEVLLLAIIHDGITHLLDTKDFSKNTLGNNLESALRSMCEVIKEAIQGDIKISSDELEKSLSLLDRFEVVEQKSRWGRGFSFLTHYQEYLYALSEGVLSKEKYKEFEKGLVLFETDLEVLSDSKIDTLINRLPPAFSNKSLVLETGFDLTEEDLIKPDVEYPKDTDPDSFKPTSYFSSSVVTKAYLRLDDSKKDVARLAFRYVLGKYDDLLAGDKPIPDEDQKILDRNGISTDFESRIAYFSKITPLGLSYFENSIKIVESENGKSLIGRAVSQFQSLSEISLLEVHVFKRMETEDVDGGAYVQDSKEVITLLKDQIEETLTNLGKIRGDLESSHPSVENYAQRVSQLFNSKNLGDLKKDIELANTTELDQVMTSAYRDLEDLKFVLDTETLAVDINQVLSILDKIKVAQVVVGRYWLSATAVDLKDSQLMMPKESRASMRTLYEGLINLNTSENGDYARVLEDFQKTISNWSDNQLHLSLKEMVAQIEFQFDAASKGITLEKEYGNPISDFAKGDLGTDDIIGFLASVLTPKTDGKDWYRWLLVAKEALSAFERGDKDEAQAFYLMARHSNLASTLSEQYDDIDSLFSTLDLAMNACMVAMAATGGTVLASVGEATSGIKKGTWAWQMLNATGFVASNMVMDAAFLGHSTVDPNDPVIKQGLVVIKEIALMTGMFKYLGYVMGGFQKTFSGPILRVVEERVGRVLTQGEQSYLFEQFLKLAKNASHSSLKTVGFVYEVNAFLAWGIFRAHLEMGLDSSGITSEEIFVQKLDWNNIKHEAAFLFGLKIGNTLAHPMTDILVGKTLGPKRAEAINNAEVEWLRLSSESERISSVLSELRSRENLKAEDTQKLHGLQKEMVSVAREINALVVRLMQNGISLNFEGMNFLRDVNGMVRSDKSLGLDSLQDIEIKRTPDGKYIVPDHVIRFAMMAGELSHSTVDGVYVLTKSTGRRVYIVQRSRVKGLSSEVKKEGKKFAPELTKWVLTRGWGRELLSNDPEIFRELVLGKASEVFTQALQIEDPKEQKQAINLALMIAQSEIKTPEPTVPVAQRSEVGIKAKKSDKKDPTDPSSPLFGLELGLGPKLAFAGVGGDIKAEEARGRITVFRQDRSNEVSSSGRSSEVDGDIALDESGVEETGTTLTELIGVLEANKKVVLERLIDISEELSNEEVQRFSDEIGLVEDRIVHWKTELTRLETTYGRDRKLYEQDIRIGQNLLLDKISRIGSELFSPEYDLRTESTDGLRSRVSTGDDTKTPLKPDKPADVDTISSLVNHDVGYGKRLQLRPHQVSVLNKFKGVLGMLRKLAQSGSVREEQLRGTVVMPTGSGKTRTMVACFAAMIEQGMYVDGDKIIILNHTTQIHSQNLEVVGLLGSYFKTSLGRTLKVSEYKAERKDLSGDVVVVSVPTVSTEQRRQSFNEELVRALGANRVALVAVDEVHHLDTTGSRSKGSWRELLKTLRMVSPDLFRIGFTATPTGREGPYIDRVREIDMMQKGVTPRTYLVRVKSDVDLTGVKVGRSKEFVVKDLERTLLGYPERNRLIYGHLERFGMRSPRLSPSGRQGLQSSLVFGVDLNHVKMMANDYVSYFGEVIEGEDLRGRELVVLGENRGKISESDLRGALKKYEKGEIDGIAVVISGQTSPKIRQAILSNVENGSIEAVFNVDVLYEGADLHMFSHLIGGRPTFSTIRKGQERGRVNRRGPADVTVDGKLLNDRPKIIFDIEDQFSGRERAPINYWNLMGIPMGVSLVDSGRLIDVVAGKVVEKVNESGEGVSRNEEATNDLPPARPVNREVVTDQDARLIEMLQDILESRYSGDIYRMSLDLGVTEEDLTGLLEGRGWQNSRSFMRRLATLLYQDRETLVEIYNESRGLLDPDVTSNDIALLRGAVALYRDWEGGTGEIVIKGDDGLGEREIVVPLHALTTLSRGSVRLVQWRTLFSGLSFYFGVKANSKELHSEESAEKLDELVEFAFIKNAWSKDSATARESLLYKTREFIVKRFGGFLPTTNIGIDGVTRQDAKGALTKYISGKDIKYTGDFYLQLRALLQGLGCKEVDELFEEVAFEEQPDWDRDISTAGKRLLFETRKLVGRKFAGGLPTDTGIDGVIEQNASAALTKYISGEDVRSSKVFYLQLRALLQGLGCEKVDELFEEVAFEEQPDWDRDISTAGKRLLFETRKLVGRKFAGGLPTDTGIDGVSRQGVSSALTKYISGKDIKYTGDFYLQLRALLQGLGCKEVDELFEEVAFEKQPDWDRDISTAGKRLLFETRKLVGRKFAGGLPTDTGIDGVSRQGVSSALTKYISGEDVKFSKVFPSQLRVLLQGLGCKEVDELFEEVAFEKQPDWDRDISTAGKRLLFETRKLVGRRFVEGLPTDTGIDGVGYQVKRSALYKYISGEEIKSSNSMSLDAFYSQVRSLLIGLDMDSLEADRLIRDARSESEIDKDDDNSSASAGGTGSPVLIKKSEPNSNSANHFQRLEDSNWSVGEALLAPLRGLYNAADSIAKSLANFVNDSFLNRAAVVGGPALIEGANALLTPSRRVNTSTLTQPMMMIGGDRGKVNVAKLERRLAEEMIDNPEYYSPENCDTNVAQFAKRNMTPEELEFARVLVFVPKDPAEVERMSDSILRPSALFTGEDTAWSIHFVLELGGRIYDYDYDGVPGEPIAKYCERMFPGQEIEIAPIKASTFVDFFDRGFPLGITVLKQVKREGIESFINKNHGEAQPYADLQSRAEIADRPVDDPAVIMDGLGMLTLKVSPSQAFTYKGLDFAFERLGHAIKRKNPERIYLKIVLPETTTITIEGVKRRVSESLISEAFEGPVTIALSRGSENFSAVVKAGKNHRVVSDLKRDVSSSTERAARFVVSPEGSIVKASPDNGEGNSVNWRPVRRVAAPSPRSSHLPKQPHGAYITPRNTGAFQGTITRQNVRMLLKDTEVLALDPEEEGRDAFYGFRVLKEGEELSRGECFWRIESIIPARNALEVKPLIFSARTFNFPNGLPDGLKNGQRIVLRFVVSLDRNPRPLVEPESISRMAAESGLAVDRRKDSEPGVFKPKLHTLPSYPDQILAQSINELVAKEVEVDIFFRDKSRIRGTLVAGKDGDYYITTPHDIVSDRLEDLIPFVEGDVAYVVPVNNTVDAKSLNKRFIKVENPQIEHGSIIHVDDSGKGPVIVVDFREPFLKIFLERNVQRVKDRYAEELSGATTGQEVRAVHREMAGTLLHVIRSFSLKQEIVNVDSFEPGLYTLSELLDYSSDIASNILMQIAMQYLGINSELQIGDTRDAYREPGRVLLADPWRKGSWVVSDDAKLTSEYALYDASEAFQIQGSSDSQYLGFRPNGKKIVRNRLEDERPLDESLENTFLFAPTVTPGSGDWTLASTSWTKKLPLPLQMAIADVKKESSDINHFQVAVETRRALRSRGIETVSFQYNVGDNLYYQIYIVDNLEFGKRSRSQTVKDKGAFDWLEALGRGSRKRSGRKLGLYFDTRYLIPGFDITASINATDMAMDWKSLSHEKFDPVTAHEGVHFVFNTAEHFDTAVILRRLADSTSNLYEGEGVGMCVFYRESPMIIEGYDPVNRVLNLKYLGVKEKNVKVGIDELLKSDWYFGVGESVYESNGTPVRPTRPSLFYSSSHLYAALILSEYSGLKGYLDPMNGYVNHELDANVYVFRRSKDRVAKLLDRTDVPKVDSKVLDEVREESYWMGVSLKYAEAFAKANYVFCHEVIEALGSGNARIRRVRSEERSFSLGYDRVIEIVDGSAKGINIYYMSAQLNSHEPAEGIDWSLERDNVLNMLKTEEQHLKREAERVKAIENDADFYKRLDELRFRYPDIIPVMMSNVKSASLEGASAAKIYGGFDRSLEVFDASNRHAVEHATEESGRAFLQRGYPSTSTEFREFFTGLLIPPTLGFGTPVEQVLEYLELLLVQAKHRPDRMSNWNFLKTVEKLSAYVRSKVYGNDEYNEHITRLDKRLEEAGFKKDGRAEPVINGIVRDDSLGGPAMMAYTLKRGESVGHHISWTVGKVVSDREFILRAGEKEVVYRFGPKAKLPEPVLSLGETVHLRSPAVISSPAIYRSLHGRSPRSKTPSPAKAQ